MSAKLNKLTIAKFIIQEEGDCQVLDISCGSCPIWDASSMSCGAAILDYDLGRSEVYVVELDERKDLELLKKKQLAYLYILEKALGDKNG